MSDSPDIPLELDRGLLSDRIYELVRSMIKDSTLTPGEQVVESHLARRLGVSQAPVREALKRLTHDGLITHVRHHGSFVTEFSRREADEARVARMALEGMVARILHGHLDPSARERLESLVLSMHDAADRNDIALFRERDFEFHRCMVESGGNTYLLRMWDIVEPSLRSMHVLSDPSYDGDWHEVAELHRDLVESLDGDDAERAADLFISHAIGLSTHPEHPVSPAIDRVIAAGRTAEHGRQQSQRESSVK